MIAIKDSNLTINVGDLETSIAFYEAIGFSLKGRWGDHYAILIAKGITIGLHPTEDRNRKTDSGNVSVGITTDNFEVTKAELEKLSIKINERSEEGGQFIHFNDPDGTAIYFINPKW